MSVGLEDEIRDGKRSFDVAQGLLGIGVPIDRILDVQCGWHGTSVSPLEGSFGLVDIGSRLDQEEFTLVGERVKVTFGKRSVYVYCLGGADLPFEFSLYMTPYMRLALPAVRSIRATIDIVQ